jgi:hypothetical protein
VTGQALLQLQLLHVDRVPGGMQQMSGRNSIPRKYEANNTISTAWATCAELPSSAVVIKGWRGAWQGVLVHQLHCIISG